MVALANMAGLGTRLRDGPELARRPGDYLTGLRARVAAADGTMNALAPARRGLGAQVATVVPDIKAAGVTWGRDISREEAAIVASAHGRTPGGSAVVDGADINDAITASGRTRAPRPGTGGTRRCGAYLG